MVISHTIYAFCLLLSCTMTWMGRGTQPGSPMCSISVERERGASYVCMHGDVDAILERMWQFGCVGSQAFRSTRV